MSLHIRYYSAILILLTTPLFSSPKNKVNLEDAISMAIKNSSELLSLKSKGVLSKRLSKEKWRSFFPDISLSYQKDDTVAYREDDYRNHTATVNMSYDIFTNGKTLLEFKISKIEAILALADYRIQKNSIVLETKSRYYELIKSYEETKVNEQLLENLLLQKKIVKKERKLGMATDLQMIQVEARISEAKYKIRKSKNEYQKKLKDFKVLLGYQFDREFILNLRPGTVALETDFSNLKKDEIVSIALRNRHEIRRSSFNLLKARKALKLAKYYYLPQVKLEGSYGYSGDKFPINKMTWSVGVTVSTNILGNSLSAGQTFSESNNRNSRSSNTSASAGIYDTPSYFSQIISARSQYKESIKSHSLLKNKIVIEAIQAFDNYHESFERLKISKENVDLVEHQAKIENAKIRLGDLTRKDILETYIQLSQARLRLLTSRTDLLLAIASLENSLGYSIGGLSSTVRKRKNPDSEETKPE